METQNTNQPTADLFGTKEAAQIPQFETIYSKGRNGNEAETNTPADPNGKMWQIRTTKARNGVKCEATECTDSGNGMISFDMFGAKRHMLATSEGMATEKKIKEVHELGLIEFSRILQIEQVAAPAVYVIGIGQIIFTDGLETARKRAVYEVVRGGQYKTVLLDGTGFEFDSHVRPFNEKFGIGSYYNEGEILHPDDLALLVQSATLKKEENIKAEQIEAQRAAGDKALKLAEGSKIIAEIPAGAVAVIVAERRRNESDLQTDYFGYSTEERVFLAFSTHKKDIFSELRKAAGKFEATAQYATAPEKPADAYEGWKPADEHREKYSMGAGYYLGESKYSGWIVEKENLSINGSYGVHIEELQVAAADGRFFCNVETEPTPAPAAEFEAVPVTAGTVQIIDYSEKAIAVIGDTKAIKEQLKALGGRFNFRLSCGAGWIFAKRDLAKVQKALGAGVQTESPDKAAAYIEEVLESNYHQNFDYVG